MAELSLDTAAQFAPASSDSDISHEVCCLDEDRETNAISLCGLTLPDGETEDGEPTCVVCQDLIDKWAEYGDFYQEDPNEPVTEPCRVCPRRDRENEVR